MLQHGFLRLRPFPAGALTDVEGVRKRLQARELVAAADMNEAPGKFPWKQGQSVKQNVIALFFNGAANAENDDGICPIGSIPLRWSPSEFGKAGKIESVIAKDRLPSCGELAQPLETRLGASHY